MIRRTLEGVWTLEDAEGEGPLPACYKDFVSRYNSPEAGSAALDFEDADAVFSDNYFSMVKKSPYHVTVKKCDILRGRFANASDVKRRLRIRSLRDTY